MPAKAKIVGGKIELRALLVKIGLKENGNMKYPPFNQLTSVLDGVDWSHYVDQYGESWHYDKKCTIQDHDPGHELGASPKGEQWGVLLVPEDFATAAMAAFPSECPRCLTETELETFYNNRAHHREPEEKVDQNVLEVIKAKREARIPDTQKTLNALDPTKDEPGITKSKTRYWADFKAHKGLQIK